MALIGTIYAARKVGYLSAFAEGVLQSAETASKSVIAAAQDTLLVAIFIFGGALLLSLAPGVLIWFEARKTRIQ